MLGEARRMLAAGRRGASGSNATGNVSTERRLFGFGILRVNDRFVEMPTCIIDGAQASSDLSLALSTVQNAIRTCRFQDTQEERLLCASSVADIMQFVGFGADFLAGAGQECADHLVKGTLCADSVALLLAGLAQIVQASTGIATVCTNLTFNELKRRHPNVVVPQQIAGDELRDGRRLQDHADAAADMPRHGDSREDSAAFRGSLGAASRRKLQSGEPTVPPNIAEELEGKAINATLADQYIHEFNIENKFLCFLHATEVAEDLSRSMDAVTASMMDCSVVNDVNAQGAQACGLDVIGIIEAFTFAANSIARAIFRCPAVLNLCADCAAMIINTIASTEDLMNAIGSLNLCTRPEEAEFIQHETHLLPAPTYVQPPQIIGQPPQPPVEVSEFVRDPGVIQLPPPTYQPPPMELPGQAPPPRPVESQRAVDSPGLLPPEAEATEFYGPEP